MGKRSSTSTVAITVTVAFRGDSSSPLFSPLGPGFLTPFLRLIKRRSDTWLGYSSCLQLCIVRTPPTTRETSPWLIKFAPAKPAVTATGGLHFFMSLHTYFLWHSWRLSLQELLCLHTVWDFSHASVSNGFQNWVWLITKTCFSVCIFSFFFFFWVIFPPETWE